MLAGPQFERDKIWLGKSSELTAGEREDLVVELETDKHVAY